MGIEANSRDFVAALERGLAVISAFGPGAEEMTLADVAKKVDLTRGTVRRLLLTLESLGYVRQDGNRFRLTPKTLTLGYSYLSSMPLWQVAQPYMRDVVDALDESCSIGMLDGLDVVYTARIAPSHFQFIPVNVGSRMRAHVTSMGLVLLAELDAGALDAYFQHVTLRKIAPQTITDETLLRAFLKDVARQGFALSDQQLQPGRRAIAVPIRFRGSKASAALNASADGSRATKSDMLKRFLPVLQSAAAAIEHAADPRSGSIPRSVPHAGEKPDRFDLEDS